MFCKKKIIDILKGVRFMCLFLHQFNTAEFVKFWDPKIISMVHKVNVGSQNWQDYKLHFSMSFIQVISIPINTMIAGHVSAFTMTLAVENLNYLTR